MIGNPRYGPIGLVSAVYFAVFEFLSPLFALLGLVVSVGLWAFGAVSTGYIAVVPRRLGRDGRGALDRRRWRSSQVGYGRYERRRDVARLLAYTVLESIGYHQLHNFWRFIGYVDIARGKTDWGVQKRRGLARPPT